MGVDDRTREVQKTPDDEVFEVGDSSIVDSAARRNSPPPQKPASKLPWLLLVLVIAGVGAAGYLFVLPMQDELLKASGSLKSTQDELASVKAKLAAADQAAAALREKSESQEKTLEEQAERLKELNGTKDELELKLKDEISRGDVLIKQVAGQLVVDLADQILFPSGAADLNDKGKEVLRRVGETMFKATGQVIQVGGHTDNQPISDKLKAAFPSNWELATSRAMNVVHFLEDEVKVPGERLVVAGYGQFRPIGKNTSKEGRKKNRRIEVVLLTKKK